jgi:hypothetical protein
MIAKRFNAKEFTVRLKATIQATGKLGFTQDTIDQLRLTSECSVFLAPDDENKKVMYMGVLRERMEDAFPVLSSGKYFYLNTTNLFKALKLDFEHKVYMFDLSRFEEGDDAMEAECYKMDLRWKERTNDDKEIKDESKE